MKSLNASVSVEADMNQDDAVLDLYVRLLVVQYGKLRVSEALSAINEVDPAAIRSEIETRGNKAKKGKTRRLRRRSLEEVIQDADPGSPEAEGVIRSLAHAYENKEFLPELRDVRRFLEARSIPLANLRSRADALPAVIGALTRCGLDELYSLDRRRRARGGDLGIITDQILGRGTGHGRSA